MAHTARPISANDGAGRPANPARSVPATCCRTAPRPACRARRRGASARCRWSTADDTISAKPSIRGGRFGRTSLAVGSWKLAVGKRFDRQQLRPLCRRKSAMRSSSAVEFPARRICECERQALIIYLATTNCEPKRVKDHMQSRRIQRSDRRGRGSVCA